MLIYKILALVRNRILLLKIKAISATGENEINKLNEALN